MDFVFNMTVKTRLWVKKNQISALYLSTYRHSPPPCYTIKNSLGKSSLTNPKYTSSYLELIQKTEFKQYSFKYRFL
jgi:hypothetical protein